MATPLTEFEDFELVPDDGFEIDPDEELIAAFHEQDPEEDPETAEPQRIPLGRDWAFDYNTGRFVTHGQGGPAQVNGLNTLKNWIMKALNTARGAHPIYDDSFGVDGPFRHIGFVDSNDRHAAYERKIKEALLEHDRIMAVDNFEFELEDSGELFVTFVVLTDFDEAIQLETPVPFS